MSTIDSERLRRQAEAAYGQTDVVDNVVLVDADTQRSFDRLQQALLTTPIDPNTLPAGPATVPFYKRRWFWAVAGVGAFGLIYSLRRQD